MLEVEKKYKIDHPAQILERLSDAGAVLQSTEQHADTYYRHPSRDFVQTKEALRIRSIDSVASVTYKGPKLLVGDSSLNARNEIEWCLAPGDSDGLKMTQLLLALGFSPVTTVRKERQAFCWPETHPQLSGFTVTIDRVQEVGLYAEIELLLPDASPEEVDAAGERIRRLAERRGVSQSVSESYLQLLLNQSGG